jgi:hypothetical protein
MYTRLIFYIDIWEISTIGQRPLMSWSVVYIYAFDFEDKTLGLNQPGMKMVKILTISHGRVGTSQEEPVLEQGHVTLR